MAASFDFKMDFSRYHRVVREMPPPAPEGRVVQVVGLIAEAEGMGQGIGSFCRIVLDDGRDVLAEVVGFRKTNTLLMPYGSTRGIRPGSRVIVEASRPLAPVGEAYLGRVIDGMGEPLDGLGPVQADASYPLYGKPINPLDRDPVKIPMDVGICAINTMIPLGRGQRVAIMAGSGVGKSVLMGMMTRHTAADVVVIGLIGERGREVKDFVEDILGEEGRKKSVVIAATSDVPPLVRMRGAYLATTMAEYFRDQGKDVLLLVDSLTRYAMSSRDVGLAAGEPPTTRGYTPSFFVQVPILLERAGTVKGKGSITGIYTVLVEGDDLNDPVGDTVRSIVDGHIVLSRQIASRGHYPAIDVLASVSRVTRDVSRPENLALRDQAVRILATYREAEDMIQIGAYVDGSSPAIDLAKKMAPKIQAFLRQRVDLRVTSEEGFSTLAGILSGDKNP
ncbi:flagellum-specific ATP synthase [Desulfobotulus alkaliphilus]|uniref:Flagellum-specific ATP synthase n=1 Tax=Desulfobotulus alkaliphilus TaxID=622671 RepID=A0A562RTJ4_9BACT|nr:FliI/YscN family ATPase [Desulfobotulus alkaliphilus]TWI72421.1 flagellum-specific ATP synthase [Desulfobotulus alkaliphilus]